MKACLFVYVDVRHGDSGRFVARFAWPLPLPSNIDLLCFMVEIPQRNAETLIGLPSVTVVIERFREICGALRRRLSLSICLEVLFSYVGSAAL